LNLLLENEKLQKEIPIGELKGKLDKLVQFFHIYENTNKKLVNSIQENRNFQKEISSITNQLEEEKIRIKDILSKVVQRIEISLSQFKELERQYRDIITDGINTLLKNSFNEKEEFIKFINKFLKEDFSANIEEVYMKLIERLDKDISKIQQTDKIIDIEIENLVKEKENELKRRKEELDILKTKEMMEKIESNRKKFNTTNTSPGLDENRTKDLDKEKEYLETKLKELQDKKQKHIKEKNALEKKLRR